jgi:hypothetical protein
MPEVLIAIVVIVALLGLYLLAWQRHSRRHTTGHWYRFRLRQFRTLGDGLQRGPYSERLDTEGPGPDDEPGRDANRRGEGA